MGTWAAIRAAHHKKNHLPKGKIMNDLAAQYFGDNSRITIWIKGEIARQLLFVTKDNTLAEELSEKQIEDIRSGSISVLNSAVEQFAPEYTQELAEAKLNFEEVENEKGAKKYRAKKALEIAQSHIDELARVKKYRVLFAKKTK